MRFKKAEKVFEDVKEWQAVNERDRKDIFEDVQHEVAKREKVTLHFYLFDMHILFPITCIFRSDVKKDRYNLRIFMLIPDLHRLTFCPFVWINMIN